MDKKHIVWEICRIAREHRKLVEKRICSLGIHPSQHHFLMYLSRHGACSQNSIAEAMGVSASTVAVSLKKLEKGGYIEKQSSTEDCRSNRIVLTPRGEAVALQSKSLFEEVDRQMFENIEEEKQEQLHGYMEQILNNLHRMEEAEDDVKECE